ncbi:hypothetical protein [Paenibacillus sp. yr247]|uniref:hypothetical protein n=1 Tax=Paenibacillus sp. yr247 TaxID=1761880 RepID=UPI001140657F
MKEKKWFKHYVKWGWIKSQNGSWYYLKTGGKACFFRHGQHLRKNAASTDSCFYINIRKSP